MLDAIRDAVTFANEQKYDQPEFATLTVISFKQVRLVLEWTIGKHYMQTDVQWALRKAQLEGEWRIIHKSIAGLEETARELRPILTKWRGLWIVGHFFGVRGMNNAKDTDVICTIGDPWLNRFSVAREADYLGLDAEIRQDQFARAELNQCQERARTCQRTKALRALHIGMQVPSGHAWTSGTVELRTPSEGAPRKERACTAAELEMLVDASDLTKTAIAAEAGLARQYLNKLLLPDGDINARPITPPVLEAIKAGIARLLEANKS